ncbi:MAG: type II toxin-antitoxin system PemK/MazF family toxin [Ignavibacteria bacterium]|nr:type II toxin-antitoxin system PemK/MazF family toxin [Ignavibacteria bacterium]
MIKSGMMLKQREICLLPIPFSDLSSKKHRPVLIISNDYYNSNTDDILVMAITSNLQDKDTSEIIEQEDMETGILKSVSQVRVDKIYSISKELIIK